MPAKKKSSSCGRKKDRQESKVGYLTFHIFGDDFTRIARTLMMEGNWCKALNLIVEGLHGVSWEQAIDVLECRAAFEGDNAFNLVKDDPESEENAKYIEQYNWLWAGSLEYRGRFFQPYARVTSWSLPDLGGPPGDRNLYMRGRLPEKRRIGGSKYSAAWRSLYYADDPHKDICLPVGPVEGDGVEFRNAQVFVLFREIVLPPVWRRGTQIAQEAYAEYIKLRQRGLEVRGARELMDAAEYADRACDGWDSHMDRDDDDDDLQERNRSRILPPGDTERDESNPLADLAMMTAATSGLPLDVVMGTVDAISGKQDTESEPQTTREPGPNGYVLRNGKFYPCNYHAHAALARRLLKWELVDGDPDIDDPEKHIEQNCGVARLSTGPVGGPRYQYMKKPTKAQEKVVVDWCIKYNVPYTGHNY